MKVSVRVLVVCGLFLACGCASITKGTTQSVQVEIGNCGEPTECIASNKKGTWEFTAPGSVTVKKSDDPLHIRCEDGDNVVTRSVSPNRDAMIWGNAIFGGVIGAGVDASTDAHWELPETVTLHRQTCRGESLTDSDDD